MTGQSAVVIPCDRVGVGYGGQGTRVVKQYGGISDVVGADF